MLARRFCTSSLNRVGARRIGSVGATEEVAYAPKECWALLGSVWAFPLGLAFAGGIWIVRRSDTLEEMAKLQRSEMKTLSPLAYREWRRKDPAMMQFQSAREEAASQLRLKTPEGYVHNPPHTYDSYTPPVRNAEEKSKGSK